MSKFGVFVACLILAGCFGASRLGNITPPDIPDGDIKDPTSWLNTVAYAFTALGAIAFIIGLMICTNNPKKGQQILVYGITAIVGSQILIFIGAWLVWIAALILIAGLAAVSYRHREKVLDYLDGETEIIEKQ